MNTEKSHKCGYQCLTPSACIYVLYRIRDHDVKPVPTDYDGWLPGDYLFTRNRSDLSKFWRQVGPVRKPPNGMPFFYYFSKFDKSLRMILYLDYRGKVYRADPLKVEAAKARFR